jgi:hypothetical protein
MGFRRSAPNVSRVIVRRDYKTNVQGGRLAEWDLEPLQIKSVASATFPDDVIVQ